MTSALILAGGKGERLWPVSTAEKPKQFLPLNSNLPLIQETFNRVKDLVDLNKIYVVTTKAQSDLVKDTLTELTAGNLIIEPDGRNTGPSAILGAAYIRKKESKDEVIIILPSDHYVGDNAAFRECLNRACLAAESNNEIVTFGIKPVRPETEYGYIAVGDEVSSGVFKGEKFIEKPSYSNAQKYIKSEKYLWNSGIFVFKIKVFLEMLEKCSPQLFKSYLEIEKNSNFKKLKTIYNQLPKLSIDYALMEKLPSFLVIPSDYKWDDLGTWRSFETILPKDSNGNIFVGLGELLDVSDCIIYSQEKNVAVIGVKGLVVASGKDGILICPKERLTDIKQIVTEIKKHHQ